MSKGRCPVCAGRQTPFSDKEPCLCKGTKDASVAFANLQELYLREVNEHEATQKSLKTLQQAILSFVFDPQFRRLDKSGYLRKYWEAKLGCTIYVYGSKEAGGLEAQVPLNPSAGADRHGQR